MRLCLLVLVCAAVLLPQNADAQARKIVLFEHFTQASCGPCASQNPAFQDNILKNNKGNILHVAYHTSWPGRDPMNTYNPEDVQNRVNFYGVSGVPHMIMNGNRYRGGPTGVTQEMVDFESTELSPLRITVEESSNGTSRHATVNVTTLNDIPAAGLKLRVYVIEADVTYATAPGSNGEKYFPNVFRRAMPDANGVDITTVTGETASYEYDYDLDISTWDTTNVHVIAFVERDGSKDIIQAGSSANYSAEFVSDSPLFRKGTPDTRASFNMQLRNYGDVEEVFTITLVSEEPSGWTAAMMLDDAPVSGDLQVTVPPGETMGFRLDATPSATAGIGTYRLTATLASDPELAPQKLQFNLISNVTDLVLNSDSPWGGGSPITSTKQTEQFYLEGLQAISSTVGATNIGTYMRAVNFDMLEGVKNLYFNSGWTFPFMDQNMGIAFINHVNEGNNLFVAGQDIGWDTWDENGNGTSASKAFYRNYLRADYLGDGGQANSSITPTAGDLVFDGLATSTLINPYGQNTQGTPNFYPDELAPRTGAFSTFTYPGGKTGAVRYASGKFKTTYFGFGMEMVDDKAVRDQIMGLTKQWFDGVINSVEYGAAVRGLALQQNYPNPAGAVTVIPFSASPRDLTLRVTDITGRHVMTRSIPAGSTQLLLPTASLQNGLYFYRVFDGAAVVGAKVMQVLR